MNRTLKRSLCGALLLAMAGTGRCQDEPKPAVPAPAEVATPEQLVATLAKEGIEVDLRAKTITIATVVNVEMDPLEYALINERGKVHEALLVTEVKPSSLNAAFLLLGYTPGQNARTELIEPQPTEEEVAQGAEWLKVFPPEGMPFWMVTSWGTGQDRHAVAIEDLILDLVTEKPVENQEWLYLGGRTASIYRGDPAVYVADLEGNLVSVCYLAPANHLGTMKHERARDDQVWWRTELCPKPGTPVELRICRDKPAEVIAREKKLQSAAPESRPQDSDPKEPK